ncbi:MAG TPA: RNA polymerase sigma factor [Polyangiales bacterium]
MTLPRLVQATGAPGEELRERSDDELMALACAGVRRAFEVLVARHAQRLVQLCARFVQDEQLGRDLAQDVWVMVYQRRESYRPEGRFQVWLITVARNHCRNQLRRSNVARGARDGLEQGEPAPAQIERILREECQRRVRDALSELSPAMREALLLRFAEELRYDEMTQVVGAGENTLRSRVHHGLRALKQKLERDR